MSMQGMGLVDRNDHLIESHYQTIFYFCTFYNRKLVLPMQSILRERGDRAARRIFSKPPAACALPKHIYQGILCAVQSCCTAAVLTTISVLRMCMQFENQNHKIRIWNGM